MRAVLAFICCWTAALCAVEIPLDEHLISASLKKGIEVWFKVQTPSSHIACRFVSQDPLIGRPHIFELDCPTEVFEDELPSFLDYCEEETQKQGEVLVGFVTVGSMNFEGLQLFLSERLGQKEFKEESISETIQLCPSKEISHMDLVLSYPTTFPALQTDRDLKKLWIFYLLQTIVESRFKQAATSVDGVWIAPSETKYLLPALSVVGHGIENVESGRELRLLKSFLAVIQNLKEQGFSDSELAAAKSRLQKHLQRFYRIKPDHEALADYYASYLAAGIPCPDYSAFMALSLHMIPEIEMADVYEVLKESLLDDTREVAVRFPSQISLTKEEIRNTLNQFSSDRLVLQQEGSKVVLEEGKDPFSQLIITEDEQRMIRAVIDTVAKKSPIKLAFIRGELEAKRKLLFHIHPLRSLASMFSDPRTKENIAEIRSSFLKWRNFIGDFSERMKQEHGQNNLEVYIPGFCQAVKANPDQVRTCINNRDWEGLVKYLLRLNNS